ncbi:amidase [Variovorax dokdonensis]|uniref:Amidase n=1 Tax=Variovorax dokdonensis TaxID=344883 RepID=A0ABT7NH77_9BURK|nr:amidase [Variovorax dokdonensis]MDM0047294.1 amidase [Variovorax dokdonensis]
MQEKPTRPDLWSLSANTLAKRFRDGSLTPLAVVQSILARIDAVNPKLNAVVARRDAAALAEAEAAGERFARGQPRSMLDGIPITVKDSLFVADMPTTCGTRALADHRPGFDELAAARAREGGALILGKTNVPEFANDGYTANPLFGVTGNPWAPDLTPGGSSGGAVAAVASGMGPLAIAQDGGGSIRRPASHTGLVGLKPSLSAWPRHRALPGLLLDFDCIGPVGRTVADVRLLFDAVRGPALADRSSQSAAWAASRPRPEGPLRVLYVQHLNANPLDREIATSCHAAVQRLAALGHRVEEGELPLDIGFVMQAWPEIGQVGLAAMFEQHPDWESAASAKYRDAAEAGRRVSGARVWRIMESVRRLRSECAALFERFDIIAMPSAAALPWPAHEPYPTHIDGQEVGPRGHAAYTGWVNAAGLPGLALPADPSRTGLPIGLQLIGPYGGDDLLLDVGAAFEAAAPWADRWPAI